MDRLVVATVVAAVVYRSEGLDLDQTTEHVHASMYMRV